ncbi:hypothetical protein NTHI1209_00508 [Haemophilus influenzae]|uniref:Uncharacterized protein n=1 Tax=Haemophilus influenzae TaxID=727 RepID=A0A158SVL1_HAEIF|nr:hypothetical protein NTHI1209_00508 [Haemophilus influenzae]
MHWKIGSVKCGHFLAKFKSKAAIFGGVLLIGIAISWLCEDGVFTF